MRNFLLKRGLKAQRNLTKFAELKSGTWIKSLTENCYGFFTQTELTNRI